MRTVISCIAILCLPVILCAQDAEAQFKQLISLEGDWKAVESGPTKTGTTTRYYELIMKGKYLHFRNSTVIPPSEELPEGEVHEDWGFFSVDTMRSKVVLRQFHSEGYVNQYVITRLDENGIELVTETIENIPPGWRAKYEISFTDADHFVEGFYLARPEGEFSCIIENQFARITD